MLQNMSLFSYFLDTFLEGCYPLFSFPGCSATETSVYIRMCTRTCLCVCVCVYVANARDKSSHIPVSMTRSFILFCRQKDPGNQNQLNWGIKPSFHGVMPLNGHIAHVNPKGIKSPFHSLSLIFKTSCHSDFIPSAVVFATCSFALTYVYIYRPHMCMDIYQHTGLCLKLPR